MKNTISGRVIRGDSYGKRLGFPTANLDRRQYRRDRLNLRFGVYAGVVVLPGGEKYRAGIVVGPVDRFGLPKLEAHLINFQGNLYGQRLELHVAKFLRPFKIFANERQLKQQIAADIRMIKHLSL